jgi:hypothetical protein
MIRRFKMPVKKLIFLKGIKRYVGQFFDAEREKTAPHLLPIPAVPKEPGFASIIYVKIELSPPASWT